MITRTDYPSYGIFPTNGLTAMPEDFIPLEDWDHPNSLNHHFMGDIKSWFLQRVCGIRVNPRLTSADEVDVAPDFIPSLSFAEAYYTAPCGRIDVRWERTGEVIRLRVDCPEGMSGRIVLPGGYCFRDEERPYSSLSRSAVTGLSSGSYVIERQYTY